MIRIKSPQDLGAAVLFFVFGTGGLWFGQVYSVGTTARIGPGYVPALMSWGLIVLGVILALRSLAIEGPKIEPGAWRPRLLILVSILAFAVLIEKVGLAVTGAITVIVAGFAAREVRRTEVVILAVVFSALCVALFVYALKQPLPIWGGR